MNYKLANHITAIGNFFVFYFECIRVFGGRASDKHYIEEAEKLVKALGDTTDYHQEFYYTAGYDSPYKLFNRRNEVWFIKKNTE